MITRRNFVKLAGAAAALAELSGHSEGRGYLRFRYMNNKGKGAS